MGVRTTSREAYHSLDNLGERQLSVFQILKESSASNTELSRKLNLPINSITPRVKELREMGLVEDKGVKVCPYTHRKVHVWGITNKQIEMFK